MSFNSPRGYRESRNLRVSPEDVCNGMCERCSRNDSCVFSSLEKIRGRYLEKTSELDLQLIDMDSTRRVRNLGYDNAYSNPIREYSGFDRRMIGDSDNCSSCDYRDSFGREGFHGSYDGKGGDGDYSEMTPRGQKSSYE